jgi:hypothetical protein
MSTKITVKSRDATPTQPGFHLYDGCLDSFAENDEGIEPPVYLRLDGIDVQLHTRPTGGASVTLALQRVLARELGLLPPSQKATNQAPEPGNQ